MRSTTSVIEPRLAVPLVIARGRRRSAGPAPSRRALELGELEQVGLGARAVVEGRRSVRALLGHRAQQGHHRRHAGPAGDEDEPPGGGVAQREDAVGALARQLVADLDAVAVGQQAGEVPALVELDHELQAVGLARRVGHRERPVLAVRAGDRDVHVLARVERHAPVARAAAATSRRMSCVSSSTASTSVVASTIGTPLRSTSSSKCSSSISTSERACARHSSV